MRNFVHALLSIVVFVMLAPAGALAEKNGPDSENREALCFVAPPEIASTGILQALISDYRAGKVEIISAGDVEAWRMGRQGKTDLLLSNSPLSIKGFLMEGYGSARKPLLRDDLVIVGPREDNARIRGLSSAVEALRRIAAAGALFMSQGGGSGISLRESDLWKAAGVRTAGQPWYQESGRPPEGTLEIAAQRRAYTICDRASYLSWKNRFSLDAFVVGWGVGDPALANTYEIVIVNSPGKKKGEAAALVDYLGSDRARGIIKKFGVDKYGSPLYGIAF